RRYRIEVGMGLEGEMPDIMASRLAERHFVPKAKLGDYGAGIENLVHAIITELGADTPEVREAKRIQREEEQRLAREKAVGQMKMVGLFVGIGVLLCLIGWFGYVMVRAIKEARRKARLRKQLNKELDMYTKKIGGISQEIITERKKAREFPSFAKEVFNARLFELELIFKKFDNLNLIIADLIKSDPDTCVLEMIDLKDTLSRAGALLFSIKGIPALIEEYADKAKGQLEIAADILLDTKRTLENREKEGFQLGQVKTLVDEQEGKLLVEQEVVAANGRSYLQKNGYDICYRAEDIIQAAKKLGKSIQGLVIARDYVAGNLGQLREQIDKIEKDQLPRYSQELNEIIKSNPPSNWEDIQKSHQGIKGRIQECRVALESAKKNNSMETQAFLEAHNQVSQVERSISTTRKTFKEIVSRKKAIKNAKESFAEESGIAARSVIKAQKKVKDSDVGDNAKELARESKEKLDKANSLAQGGSVDWIAVALLLVSAATLAAKATEQAKNDINEAERERKRKKEEEERRRRRRRASYSSSSTSYGGGYGGGSFGGGFSGGGGGGFSGGGASGGW
ncbi:TPM domain-containing protein, partial [Patescibacteria group bacterium]